MFWIIDRQQATNYSSGEHWTRTHTRSRSHNANATPMLSMFKCKIIIKIIAIHRFFPVFISSVLLSSLLDGLLSNDVYLFVISFSQSLICFFFFLDKIFNRFLFLTIHLGWKWLFFLFVCALSHIKFVGHQTTQHIRRHICFVMVFRHLHFHRGTKIMKKSSVSVTIFPFNLSLERFSVFIFYVSIEVTLCTDREDVRNTTYAPYADECDGKLMWVKSACII